MRPPDLHKVYTWSESRADFVAETRIHLSLTTVYTQIYSAHFLWIRLLCLLAWMNTYENASPHIVYIAPTPTLFFTFLYPSLFFFIYVCLQFFSLYCLIFLSVSPHPLPRLSSNRCLVRQGACRSKRSYQSYHPAQQLNSASVQSLLQRPQLLPAAFILDSNRGSFLCCHHTPGFVGIWGIV